MGALSAFGYSDKEFKKFFTKLVLEKQEKAYLLRDRLQTIGCFETFKF